MGLEIVEVTMEIEDVFGVYFPNDNSVKINTVSDLQQFVINNINHTALENAEENIPANDPDGLVSVESYNQFKSSYPIIPESSGVFKKKLHTPKEILSYIKRIREHNFTEKEIKLKIIQIIKDRIGSDQVKESDHLFNDLGLD